MIVSTLFRQLAMACAGLLFTASAAFAWPLMTGDTRRSECVEALAIASAQFKSDSFSMRAPLPIAAAAMSRLVLSIDQEDIGSGDAQIADSNVFGKMPYPGDPNVLRNLYWQISPRNGKRLIVAKRAFGWHGDLYTYYLADASVPVETFLVDPEQAQSYGLRPVIQEAWRPLQLLQNSASGQLWAIDQNEERSWDVYILDEAGMSTRCRIAFMPAVTPAVQLLPKPAQRLASLLAGTLGPGKDEGTLQPTARIKYQVEQTWANAAIRPWALQRELYNSRAEVDDGLKKWAMQGPDFRKAYRAILRQYPRAIASLGSYYRSTFHVSSRAARTMAIHSMDYLYRSYFVFRREPSVTVLGWN
ncbi:hypothetical protein [Mesorhizobium sp. WSM3859]|uniref:hypothetical protein n=1 Tax=Mesorhizobium sp. WSM3859 TaxID=2029402 RepID=UPI000BB098C6|nr:hypothetical protein [Mesorhizobium sp. WSM3859]PBC12068.1 hypothetical protein CK230_01580 [Mesorhizobium sp. WSM3859]